MRHAHVSTLHESVPALILSDQRKTVGESSPPVHYISHHAVCSVSELNQTSRLLVVSGAASTSSPSSPFQRAITMLLKCSIEKQ